MNDDPKTKLDMLLTEAMNAEVQARKFYESRNQGKKIESSIPTEEAPPKAEVEGEFEPNKDEIVKVLGIGIEAEKKAQEKYRAIAKMFDDEEGKSTFNNMAEEERKHQTILENQFYSMSNTGKIIWGD
jgi:rubrerythrin